MDGRRDGERFDVVGCQGSCSLPTGIISASYTLDLYFICINIYVRRSIYVEIYMFQIVNDVTLPRYTTRIMFTELREIRRKNSNES